MEEREDRYAKTTPSSNARAEAKGANQLETALLAGDVCQGRCAICDIRVANADS